VSEQKVQKNKVGLTEAFEDRNSKGWAWNNMILQRWTDHEGAEHRVLDDYSRNITLCDLTAQPENIKQSIKDTIQAEIDKEKNISQVGIRLIKFCATYDLVKVSEQAQSYSDPLNARYHQ
jgi:hypothetical protein